MGDDLPRALKPIEVECIGCGKKHKSETKRFDHLMYHSLRRRSYNGPTILSGWVCNEVCAVRSMARIVPYLCDQCDKPATTSTWFRLQDTEMFVRTKRCDDHPYEPPAWVLRLRRPPRRPSKRRVS